MQFIAAAAALLATASSALALPAPAAAAVSMTADGAQWTIESFSRTCELDAGSCAYSYSINTNDGSASTPCAYSVNGSPASRASYQNIACGAFTIGSNWSGQFGPGNGFSTLSVVKGNDIAFPSYADKDVPTNGAAVTPDRSFAVQHIS